MGLGALKMGIFEDKLVEKALFIYLFATALHKYACQNSCREMRAIWEKDMHGGKCWSGDGADGMFGFSSGVPPSGIFC